MLPVDDALLGKLKPLGGGKVNKPLGGAGGTAAAAAAVERPLVLKKLSIAAGVSGSILRAWDFLHLNSQVLAVCLWMLVAVDVVLLLSWATALLVAMILAVVLVVRMERCVSCAVLRRPRPGVGSARRSSPAA